MTKKFRKGMHVRMTKLAIKNWLHSPRRITTGIVVSNPHKIDMVTIHKDTFKSKSSYHVDFWEPDPNNTRNEDD